MKKLTLLLLFFMLSTPLLAQISIGYYPIQSELSFSSNTERHLWGDLRIATNTFFGNITTESILAANIIRKENTNIYIGLGTNFNFFNAANNISVVNGYSIHLGTRIKPTRTINSLQLVFEVSPYINKDFDGGLFRTRLGLAYQFKKKDAH